MLKLVQFHRSLRPIPGETEMQALLGLIQNPEFFRDEIAKLTAAREGVAQVLAQADAIAAREAAVADREAALDAHEAALSQREADVAAKLAEVRRIVAAAAQI